MNKIAKTFFDNHIVDLDHLDDFFNSDLYLYFKLLYKKEIVISKHGMIKVIEKGGRVFLSEHIYHDYFPLEVNCYFLSFEGLELKKSYIKNSELSESLSKNGYALVDGPSQAIRLGMSKITYKHGDENQSLEEPYATFKYKEHIWGEMVENDFSSFEINLLSQIREYMEHFCKFSDVLASMDRFDVNLLEWREGRAMAAHNGVDYRSFLNLIMYSEKHTSSKRDLIVGEYNWYEKTFNCLFKDDFSALMNIDDKNIEYNRICSSSTNGILINSFNPRFFHQVSRFEGEGSLYVCTANRSFGHIVKDIDFIW